jgi:hypothetical protein
VLIHPRLSFDSFPQRNSVTHQACSAIHVAAAASVVDSVAVANIETVLGAISPNRVLDEPGKDLRKRWIELPGIDPLRHGLNYVGATAGPVAGDTVAVFRFEPSQNAGAVQKVMNQRVGRSRPPSGISTVTATPSANSLP